MPDKKISELVNLTSLAADDEFVVVDAGANATKRITATNLNTGLNDIPDNKLVPDGGTIGSASDPDAMAISSGGVVTFSQGLSFGADTLDDYEEGTWTPTYGTTGTNFSSVTYLSDQTYGRYIKVGSLVYLYGALRTSAVTKGSASGILTVEGIPFAAADFGGTSRYIMGSASAEDFITEWPTSVAINTGSTPNALWLFTNRDNGDATLLDVNNVSTGSGDNWIYGFAISYHTNA